MPLPSDANEQISEMITEMRNVNSPRTRSLLQTNVVEFLLKECMVKMIGSEEARNIPANVLVSILRDKGKISESAKQTINLIFKVRGYYAHRISLTKANELAENEISNMQVVKDQLANDALLPQPEQKLGDWNNRPLDRKIADITEFMTFALSACYETI